MGCKFRNPPDILLDLPMFVTSCSPLCLRPRSPVIQCTQVASPGPTGLITSEPSLESGGGFLVADTQSSLCMLWMRTDSPIRSQYSQPRTNHRRALISSPPTRVTRRLEPGGWRFITRHQPRYQIINTRGTGPAWAANQRPGVGAATNQRREQADTVISYLTLRIQ